MIKKTFTTIIVLFLVSTPVLAFDLATKITKTGNTVHLESIGYTKLNLLKEKTSLSGSILATGKLSVTGSANIIMWVEVEGKYYFSKIPTLQNIKDLKEFSFSIPFNASNKTATEVIIEVEMLSKGSVSISDLSIKNG